MDGIIPWYSNIYLRYTIISEEALPFAATPKNIISRFIKTGIWPYNKNVFSDEDYLCSTNTNIPFTADSINYTVAIELPTNVQPQSTTKHVSEIIIDHTSIQ